VNCEVQKGRHHMEMPQKGWRGGSLCRVLEGQAYSAAEHVARLAYTENLSQWAAMEEELLRHHPEIPWY
jgi:hypothetical protein